MKKRVIRAIERRLLELGDPSERERELQLLRKSMKPHEFKEFLANYASALAFPNGNSGNGWRHVKHLKGKVRRFETERSLGFRERLGNQSVYVISCEGYPVKIGIAKSPELRLRELQVGCPYRLHLYFSIEVEGDARKIEKHCHNQLSRFRLEGEWFEITVEEAIEAVQFVVRSSIK